MATKPHNPAPLSLVEAARVKETLDRVLASPAFRKSDQCQRFLRYVVEHSRSNPDDLKERTIGVEVFGRHPDYDTAEDPIVRVRATEVRKRLSQYYGETTRPEDVRIEIPSGAYRAEFYSPESPAPAAARVKSRPRWTIAVLAVAALVAVFSATLLLTRRTPPPPDVLDRFWAPVLQGEKPALLYCGQPVVYFLSRDVHERFRSRLPADQLRGSYVLKLGARTTIKGSDVIPVTDQFVGIGNAHTASMLAMLFAARRKMVEIRYANDLSFSDLRSAPSVLIGGFSNLWTLEMQRQLRFVFEQENGERRIRDRSGKRSWQLAELAPDGKTPEDYALVSRLSGPGQ